MKKLAAKLAQLIEFPRYLAFVWRACGAPVALRALAWTLLSAPAIVRSGTLRSVDARLSQLRHGRTALLDKIADVLTARLAPRCAAGR